MVRMGMVSNFSIVVSDDCCTKIGAIQHYYTWFLGEWGLNVGEGGGQSADKRSILTPTALRASAPLYRLR